MLSKNVLKLDSLSLRSFWAFNLSVISSKETITPSLIGVAFTFIHAKSSLPFCTPISTFLIVFCSLRALTLANSSAGISVPSIRIIFHSVPSIFLLSICSSVTPSNSLATLFDSTILPSLSDNVIPTGKDWKRALYFSSLFFSSNSTFFNLSISKCIPIILIGLPSASLSKTLPLSWTHLKEPSLHIILCSEE